MKTEDAQAAIVAAALPEGFVCTLQECYGSISVEITRKGGLAAWRVGVYGCNTVHENAELIRNTLRQWMKTENAPDLAGGGWWQD